MIYCLVRELLNSRSSSHFSSSQQVLSFQDSFILSYYSSICYDIPYSLSFDLISSQTFTYSLAERSIPPHSTRCTSILQSFKKTAPIMTLSTALILSFACLYTVFAAPTPQGMQQVACQVEKYTVEKTEEVAGKPFMSTSTCNTLYRTRLYSSLHKADISSSGGSQCGLVRDAWTVVPLVSQNLVNERFNDEQ